jgi:hypothetical protein
VEQELVAPTEHPSSSPVVSGVRVPQSLSFCVVVSGSLLVFLSICFFFAIVLSVLLQFTTCYYPFGIFNFFSCIY